MPPRTNQDQAKIPTDSLIFGYGPTFPLIAAAIGVWVLPKLDVPFVIGLAIIWAAIVLVFVAGVRRGFGFGDPKASTLSEITAMLVYFTAGGVSLVLGVAVEAGLALALQIVGLVLVAWLDRRAGLTGDAPRHFARLRPPQMTIMAAALAVLLIHLWFGTPLTLVI